MQKKLEMLQNTRRSNLLIQLPRGPIIADFPGSVFTAASVDTDVEPSDGMGPSSTTFTLGVGATGIPAGAQRPRLTPVFLTGEED